MNKQAYNGAYSRRRFSNFEIETGESIGATPAPRVLKVAWNGTMGSVTGTGGFAVSGASTPPDYGIATVAEGDTVTLTATANAGYHFVRWNGPVTGKNTSNPVDVKMTQHCEVIAVFAPDMPGEHHDLGGDHDHDAEKPTGYQHEPQGGIVDQVKPFVKKWWWAILIVAYIAYKEWKGARQ